MFLAIDIGNTNLNLGLFAGKRLLRQYRISTRTKSYLLPLKKIFSRQKINEAIICSTVPLATQRIAKDLRKILGRRPKLIGRDIKVPIKNLYRKPQQVGQDRLVNAYAGIKLYGAPLIVADFGTAITFDVISGEREYLGGMILPGLQISLDCLAERTALLPKTKLSLPKEFVGRDTQSGMLSGVVFGFAGLTDNLVEKIKQKIGGKVKVVGTGGNIELVGRYCRQFDKVDSDLTLKGLNLVFSQ